MHAAERADRSDALAVMRQPRDVDVGAVVEQRFPDNLELRGNVGEPVEQHVHARRALSVRHENRTESAHDDAVLEALSPRHSRRRLSVVERWRNDRRTRVELRRGSCAA